MEVHSLNVRGLYFLHILLVFLTEDDILEACALGCEDFFLDPAHRQHFAAKGDLPGHGQVGLDGFFEKRGGQGGQYGNTCRGSVFRDSALGHVQVYIALVKQLRVDT